MVRRDLRLQDLFLKQKNEVTDDLLMASQRRAHDLTYVQCQAGLVGL
jgi:hypothetical protein